MRGPAARSIVACAAVLVLASCSLLTSYNGLVAGGEADSGFPSAEGHADAGKETADTSPAPAPSADTGAPSMDSSADSALDLPSDAAPPEAGGEGGPSDGTAPGDAGPPTFAGNYTCTATTDVIITSPISDSVNENVNGTLMVTESGNVATTKLSVPSGGVQTDCTLTFAVSGTTATISPVNQTCSATITSPVSLTVTMKFVSGGSASLSGSTMTSSLPYTATGTFEGEPADAHGTLSVSCTK
jgi:hypothetical protein